MEPATDRCPMPLRSSQDRLGWCSADHSWSTVSSVWISYLLLYFTNGVNPTESYFHTVIFHSPEFRNTTVNSDLSHILWDSTPPASGPVHLKQSRNCGTRKSSQVDEKLRTSSEGSRRRQNSEDDIHHVRQARAIGEEAGWVGLRYLCPLKGGMHACE
ncbi:hypothetical protein OPV22_007876 [Ensete ventricosum]|uniref:Uncharacterized protein n=1 Tax=Ensete ventricosum TaxID=4639 RepID=A0AAV8RDF3_ENSVE|nr:hypothetical protein OPV22_007876 [Ensete ventricosum]